MRNVGEQAAAETPRSNSELYEVLAGNYGRVLRIQTYYSESNWSDIFDRAYLGDYEDDEIEEGIFDPERKSHHFEDVIGKVVKVSYSRENSERGSRSEDNSLISLTLETSEPKSLSANLSAVYLFQQDVGSWKLLHSGSGFREGLALME